MEKNSQFAGQTTAQSGIDKLPGVVLISIERPMPMETSLRRRPSVLVSIATGGNPSVGDDGDGTLSVKTNEPVYTTIEPDEPLQDGDVLWFAGSASAVGDLRKIPGLVSFESDEVKKVRMKARPTHTDGT